MASLPTVVTFHYGSLWEFRCLGRATTLSRIFAAILSRAVTCQMSFLSTLVAHTCLRPLLHSSSTTTHPWILTSSLDVVVHQLTGLSSSAQLPLHNPDSKVVRHRDKQLLHEDFLQDFLQSRAASYPLVFQILQPNHQLRI